MKDNGLTDEENKKEEELPQHLENEESVIGTVEKYNGSIFSADVTYHWCFLLILWNILHSVRITDHHSSSSLLLQSLPVNPTQLPSLNQTPLLTARQMRLL